MRAPTSYVHITHLIGQLRTAARENVTAAMAHEHGGLGLCLGAALANDAADALESFMQLTVANDPIGLGPGPGLERAHDHLS